MLLLIFSLNNYEHTNTYINMRAEKYVGTSCTHSVYIIGSHNTHTQTIIMNDHIDRELDRSKYDFLKSK